MALAGDGAVLTATAVYPEGGRRVGIDRDEDGWLDGDELRKGTDAADPTSFPHLEPPADLMVEVDSGRVSLTWAAATQDSWQVAGYNVYRSQVEGDPGARVNEEVLDSTAFADTGLSPGEYFYSVATVAEGYESKASFQVTALVAQGGVFFLRGNCNGDGTVSISDAIFSLKVLFSGGGTAPCEEACEANGDGEYNLVDPVFLLSYLFSRGAPPGEAFPNCERAEENCAQDVCPDDG